MPRPFGRSRFSGASGSWIWDGSNPCPSSPTRTTRYPASRNRSMCTCFSGFCALPCLIALAIASRTATSTQCWASSSIPSCTRASRSTTWTSSMFSKRLPRSRWKQCSSGMPVCTSFSLGGSLPEPLERRRSRRLALHDLEDARDHHQELHAVEQGVRRHRRPDGLALAHQQGVDERQEGDPDEHE